MGDQQTVTTKALTDHVALVRGIYSAFGAGDVPSVLSKLSPDVRVVNAGPADLEYFGVRAGRDAFADLLALLGREFDFSEHRAVEFFATGDRVAVLLRVAATIRSTGRSYATDMVEVWTVGADGLVSQMQVIQDSAAVAAALRP